jgi:hypothetical protein
MMKPLTGNRAEAVVLQIRVVQEQAKPDFITT